MKSLPRKSWSLKYKEIKQWHPWYAWRPILAGCNKDSDYERWVWLETVERKWIFAVSGGGWTYRILK